MAEHQVPTDECSTCHASIVWAAAERTLKPMPVDAEPSPDGNVQLIARDGGRTPLARVLGPADRFGKTGLRKSHFVTCPQADRWRSRGRGRRQS